jgi:hypothetical protein
VPKEDDSEAGGDTGAATEETVASGENEIAPDEPTETAAASNGESGDSPMIQSRDENDTDAADSTAEEPQGGDEEQATEAATQGGEGQATDEASNGNIAGQAPGDTGEGQGSAGSDSETEAASASGPIAFGELGASGYVPASGVLLPSGSGYYALEQNGGGLQIIAADGTVLTSGWGYNPVWSSDGQSIYTANGALIEDSSSINQWIPGAGGPTFASTAGSGVFDVPAGAADDGLYYIRYQPGMDPAMELHFLAGGDSVVWSSSEYSLTGQGIYLSGGTVFAPTNQGWLAIPTGGGEASVVGGSGDGVFDIVLSSSGGEVAFVAGGTVYIAPASSPSSAAAVGELGNGGFAWTPYGLAVASGRQVVIVSGGTPITVIEGGGDLTAPIWTDAGLQVADMAEGGAARLLPAGEIEAILGG